MRESGYRIFHDILGNGFNIDHIIISDRGIFTVETKTYSKPGKGRSEIHFDGEALLLNGRPPHRDPVVQAKAQADWCRQTLQESTGKVYPVKSVIVFPGWFVRPTAEGKRSTLWVLNPKALPSFIQNEPQRLKPEEVQLAAYHLSRYIRTQK
ncbi:MAG: nuclease-related domain-containing protein [Cyanobacteria bacterium]|nr:nuclease-related domain-containing protein [Cyanobacteriota bacterium]